MEDKIYSMWLSMVFGPSNARIWKVLKHFNNNPKDAYTALTGKDFPVLNEREKSSVFSTHIEHANQMLRYVYEKLECNIVTFFDDNYPKSLKHIYNPPLVLYVKGNLGAEIIKDKPMIAIVGSRKVTDYYRRVTATFARQLSRCGFVIVSGFAVGTDFVAHCACFQENQPTIAVLGSGIDYNYPTHFAAKNNIAQCGAVITEYSPGTQPFAKNFPLRNRIISGLSKGVIVIQAGERSGSLVTADCALEQGRDVFCVPPHDIFNSEFSGVFKYFHSGAIPACSYIDIIKEYYKDLDENLNEYTEIKNTSNEPKNINNNKVIDLSEFSEDAVKVYKALGVSEIHIDNIAEQTGLHIRDVLSAVTELLFEDAISELPGQRYKLSN